MSVSGQLRDNSQMGSPVDRQLLLQRMDRAFSDYYQEAEKLSVLLGMPQEHFSWTSYHGLLRQRTAETAAYEKYRLVKDELFRTIPQPYDPQL